MKNELLKKKQNAEGEFDAVIVYGDGPAPGEDILSATNFLVIDDMHSGYTLEIVGWSPDEDVGVSLAVKDGYSDVPRNVEVHGSTSFWGSKPDFESRLSQPKGIVRGFVNSKTYARCDSFEFSGQSDLLQTYSVKGSFDVKISE